MKKFITCFVAMSLVLTASAASAEEPNQSTTDTVKEADELVAKELKDKIEQFTEDLKSKVDKTEFNEIKAKVEQCLAKCETPTEVHNVRSSVRRTVRRSRRASSQTKAKLLEQLDTLFERFEDRFDRLEDILSDAEDDRAKLHTKVDAVLVAIRSSGGKCEAGMKILAELSKEAQTFVAREVAKAYTPCKTAEILNRTSVVEMCIKHGGETFMSPNGTFICEKPTAASEPSERDALQRLDPKADGSASQSSGNPGLAVAKILGTTLGGAALGCGIAAGVWPSVETPDGDVMADACWKGGAIGAGLGLLSGFIWAEASDDLDL